MANLCGVTTVNRPAALERVQAAMAPAPLGRLEEWIAALHAATKHRGEDTSGLSLILGLYRATLTAYPSDVARQACLTMATECEWFPPLAELKARCEKLVAERKALLSALERWRELTADERESRSLEAKANSLRDERTKLARRLGFVGNIASLTPDRKAMFDEIKELDTEISRLERDARMKLRAPA